MPMLWIQSRVDYILNLPQNLSKRQLNNSKHNQSFIILQRVWILQSLNTTWFNRLFSPINQQILISRDLFVDENASWNWSKFVKQIHCVLEDSGQQQDEEHENTVEPESRRSQMQRFPSYRLIGHEIYSDNLIIDEGKLVHLEFVANS